MNLDQTKQAEIMHSFEKGRRLYQLVNQTGWPDLLDIVEAEVIKAEFRLINLGPGSPAEMLRDLHSHARAARTIFERMQLRVNAEIDMGLEATHLETASDSTYANL